MDDAPQQRAEESRASIPAGAPPAFHLLAKPTGSVCNLDCAYCFFLEKEKLYPGSRSRMSDETPGALHPGAHRCPPHARGDHRLAGRRADAHGPRVLPPGRGAGEAIRTARHDRPAHHPDQRHQDQRRLGALLRGQRLPRRPQRRRAARAARRLSPRQGRQAHVRQGHARSRGPARARRRVERADDRARRQRRAPRPRSTASCATTAAAGSSSSSPSSSGRPRTACPTAPRSRTGR